MTRKFNDDEVVENLYLFIGETKKEHLPHGVTENDFWERLNPVELGKIQKDIVYSMIRRKIFDDARVLKRKNRTVKAKHLSDLQKR